MSTISYVQSVQPLWYVVNNEGTSAGGAQLFTYDNLTHLPKPVYQDAGGVTAWPNPLIFDLNGTKGPIYWKVDSANPTDQYYFEIYDKDGNLIGEPQSNFPSSASGGGGNVTTFLPLKNYIANNQFVNQLAVIPSPLTSNVVLFPSNHRGFTPAVIPIIGTYGALGPNIRFVKSPTSNATDSIFVTNFPLGSGILTDDVTPVRYLRYQCTNTPSNEQYKSFQFPITQKVQNLSNQEMTFTIWGAVNSLPVDIKIYARQYFGSGLGSSTEVRTQIGTCSLTTTWTKFTINFTMPSVAGKTLGSPGFTTNDDAVYIQVEMPLEAPCDVFFTKPCLYLGTLSPQQEFETYDEIDSIDQTARTGDVKLSYLFSAPFGWANMDDGTIGNTGSGATNIAGESVYQLYKTLWDTVSFPSGNIWASVSGGLGATATADFLAGKVMTLPKALGRALAGAGAGSGLTSRALGEFTGTESVGFTILAANLPPHNHTYTYTDQGIGSGFGFAEGTNKKVASSVTGNGPGVSTPISLPNMQPTSFMNIFIKL